jgi:hypothetical protein
VEPSLERADIDAALAGLFDVNAKLTTLVEDVGAIRGFFEDGEDEEEAESNG